MVLLSASAVYFNKHLPTFMSSFHLLQTSLVNQLIFDTVPSADFKRNVTLKQMSHRGVRIRPLFPANVCHVLFTCGNFSLHLEVSTAFFQLLLKAYLDYLHKLNHLYILYKQNKSTYKDLKITTMFPGILLQLLGTSPPDKWQVIHTRQLLSTVDMSQWLNLLRKGRSTMKIQDNKQNPLCEIHVLAPTHAPFHTQRSRGRKTKTSKSYLFADTFKINFCPKSKSGNFIWFYFL